jgi:hypothetical protein
VLAYHLLISIEKTPLDNSVHTSWATIRDILKTHDPHRRPANRRWRMPAHPEGRDPRPRRPGATAIFNISPDIIKPQYTWAPQDSD